jgi:putative ABC transport system ATP-binding protein
MDLLTGLNRDKGVTIVMVTHEPDMASYAKRVVHFLDGLVESDKQMGGKYNVLEHTSSGLA